VDLLYKRLGKDAPRIKIKSLKVIRYLVEEGHVDFKRDVAQRKEPVKACVHFRGETDPFKGDSLNKTIREESQAIVNALYDTDIARSYGGSSSNPTSVSGFAGASMGSQNNSNNSQNYNYNNNGGNNNYSSATSFSGGNQYDGGKSYSSENPPQLNAPIVSTGTMQGFGNPYFENNNSKGGKNKNANANFNANYGGSSYGGGGGYTPGTGFDVVASAGFGASNSSYPGGGSTQHVSSFNNNINQNAPPIVSQGPSMVPNFKLDSSKSVTGELEEKLVKEICAKVGVRVAPTKQALSSFVERCSNLNAGAILEGLFDQLAESDWKTQLRALHAIEALALSSASARYLEILKENAEYIEEKEEDEHASLKNKAVSILSLIDPDYVAPVSMERPTRKSRSYSERSMEDPAPPSLERKAAPVASANLLDFEGGTSSTTAAPLPNGSLFSGMTMQGAAPPQPSQPSPQVISPPVEDVQSGGSERPTAVEEAPLLVMPVDLLQGLAEVELDPLKVPSSSGMEPPVMSPNPNPNPSNSRGNASNAFNLMSSNASQYTPAPHPQYYGAAPLAQPANFPQQQQQGTVNPSMGYAPVPVPVQPAVFQPTAAARPMMYAPAPGSMVYGGGLSYQGTSPNKAGGTHLLGSAEDRAARKNRSSSQNSQGGGFNFVASTQPEEASDSFAFVQDAMKNRQ